MLVVPSAFSNSFKMEICGIPCSALFSLNRESQSKEVLLRASTSPKIGDSGLSEWGAFVEGCPPPCDYFVKLV